MPAWHCWQHPRAGPVLDAGTALLEAGTPAGAMSLCLHLKRVQRPAGFPFPSAAQKAACFGHWQKPEPSRMGSFSPSRLLNLPRAACCRGHSSSRCLMAGRRNRGYGCMDCGHAAIHFTIMQREDAMEAGSARRGRRSVQSSSKGSAAWTMSSRRKTSASAGRLKSRKRQGATRPASRSSATIHAPKQKPRQPSARRTEEAAFRCIAAATAEAGI